MDSATAPAGPSVADRLRIIMAALFFFGAAGMLVELVLLEHTESFEQWLPFVAIGAGALALVWGLVRPSRLALRAIQAAGALVAVVGALGVWYHYRGNRAFELEMDPGSGGLDLMWYSLTGATPALAPGLMVQMGLLAMAFTYRHPAWSGGLRTSDRTEHR